MQTPATPVPSSEQVADEATYSLSQQAETEELAQYYDSLLKIENASACSCIEKAPLAVKLFLLTATSFVGVLLFAVWILTLNVSGVITLVAHANVERFAALSSKVLNAVQQERVTSFYMAINNIPHNTTLVALRETFDSSFTLWSEHSLLRLHEKFGKDKHNAVLTFAKKINDIARIQFDILLSCNDTNSVCGEYVLNATSQYNEFAEKFIELVVHICGYSDSSTATQLSLLLRIQEQLLHEYEAGQILNSKTISIYKPWVSEEFIHGRETRIEIEQILFSLLREEQYIVLQRMYSDTAEYVALTTILEPMLLQHIFHTNESSHSLPSWGNEFFALRNQLKNVTNFWVSSFMQNSSIQIAGSVLTVVAVVVVLVAFIVCTCLSGLLISRTIISPWRRLNILQELTLNKFVPKDFMHLLKVRRVVDVKTGISVQTSITVLHCQVASFKSMACAMNQKEKFDFTMKFATNMGPIIRMHQGCIEKVCAKILRTNIAQFGAASFIAIFKSRKNAVMASFTIYEQFEREMSSESAKYLSLLKPVIGIHACKASLIGMIGDEAKFETVIISDALDVAAALAGLNSKLKTRILASRDVVEKLECAPYRKMGSIVVNHQSVETIEVFPPSDHLKLDSSTLFNAAIVSMISLDFQAAVTSFKSVLLKNPKDVSAEAHLHACVAYLSQNETECANVQVQNILHDPIYCQAFEQYLKMEYSSENLYAWKLINEYQANVSKRKDIALEIYNNHVCSNSPYPININTKIMFAIVNAMQTDTYGDCVFDELKVQTEFLMLDSFKRFKFTDAMKKAVLQRKIVHSETPKDFAI